MAQQCNQDQDPLSPAFPCLIHAPPGIVPMFPAERNRKGPKAVRVYQPSVSSLLSFPETLIQQCLLTLLQDLSLMATLGYKGV